MFLHNKKGETLVETIVSLLILTIMLTVISQMVMTSLNLMRQNNQTANAFAQELADAQKGIAETAENADITITFKVGGTEKSESVQVPLASTSRGIIFFED